jgi:DNA-binding transcriptional MerR regulator
MHSTSTLKEWSEKGVISRPEEKNNRNLYPDIVTIEILAAIRLMNKYSLEEIAKARSYFNFENKTPYHIEKKTF